MDKIPFDITIALVLALSVEVRGNAGNGICSYNELQFSVSSLSYNFKRNRRVINPGNLSLLERPVIPCCSR